MDHSFRRRGAEVGDFDYVARSWVDSPLAALLAMREITAAHFGAVFAEPDPIAFGRSSDCGSLGPDSAGVVMFDVLLLRGFAHDQVSSLSRISKERECGLALDA